MAAMLVVVNSSQPVEERTHALRSLRVSANEAGLKELRLLAVVGGAARADLQRGSDGSFVLEVEYNSIDFPG